MTLAQQAYFDLGGTIRSTSPEDTLKKLNPLLKSFGITRVANVTGLDSLNIPVAICVRPNAKHLCVSQGKGMTWALAKISAIMESIEGYHAENPSLPDLFGTYTDLSSQHLLAHPNLFSAGFFQQPDIEQWELEWILSYDLIHRQIVYIPHKLICMNSQTWCRDNGFFLASTNGLASGNTIEEAICHGIYEIIERVSLCKWYKLSEKMRQETAIQLETIDSTFNQTIIQQILIAGLSVNVWEITSTLGIPAFHCTITENYSLRKLPPSHGSGAHISKEIALSRALTEAAQSRLTFITGSRDDVFPKHYQQQYKSEPQSSDHKAARDFKHCASPVLGSHSFSEHINYLVDTLLSFGFSQVLVVNHTKAAFQIPVVHVFIPGMRINGTHL